MNGCGVKYGVWRGPRKGFYVCARATGHRGRHVGPAVSEATWAALRDGGGTVPPGKEGT